MRPSLAPTHLLFLHHSFTDHIVHSRFHECRRDRFPMTVPIAIVWDEEFIGIDVIAEFLHRLQQLPLFLRTSFYQFDPAFDVFNHRQSAIDIPVPQKPIHSFNGFSRDTCLSQIWDKPDYAMSRIMPLEM